jgi:HlyD family secretion protein
MKRLTNKAIITIFVLICIVFLAGWYFTHTSAKAASFETVPIERGNLLATIAATGTLEPEEVVDVGTQVAGQIISFGKDRDGKPIDYGSIVDANMMLAQIDDSLYKADDAQANAQLLQAQANVEVAQANIEQANAKLFQAQRDWERAQKLGSSEALAQSSYDGYKSAYETAKAALAVSQASLAQAKASVTQAEGVVWRTQRNLGYCIIKSPVSGVVIDRRVNIGQTVVSSFNTPSLFLIAKDLKRMQVWVSVNEADIGHIHQGQPVTFTVTAYPGEEFKGEVRKVRLNATMTSNVVTYTVEVATDNSSGKLFPYLTANVQFEIERKNNVLLVPRAALRFTPKEEQVAPEFRQIFSGTAQASQAAPQASSNNDVNSFSDYRTQGVLWVKEGKFVKPVTVITGLSDNSTNTMTEVESSEIKEGLQVVIGEAMQTSSSNAPTNPFLPNFRRGGGGRGAGRGR